MEFTGPYKYKLFISGNENERYLDYKKQGNNIVNFSKPVTNEKQAKIYVIKQDNNIIYVGYAGQPIGNRIRGGLKSKGNNGYHGYAWKTMPEVDLNVFVFKPFTGDTDADKEYKLFVEAIEAELVYLVRTKTGYWPQYQSEIHFNNAEEKKVKELAYNIYKKINNN